MDGYAIIYDTPEGAEHYYEVFGTPEEARAIWASFTATGREYVNPRLVAIIGPIETAGALPPSPLVKALAEALKIAWPRLHRHLVSGEHLRQIQEALKAADTEGH